MIISWSGGVNSTAIIALYLLKILKGKPEIVFADTGAELPETYAYIKVIKKHLAKLRWPVTFLDPLRTPQFYPKSVHCDLYHWLWIKKTIPGRQWKRCQSDFKRNPLKRYAAGRTQLIGMCADEPHRFKNDGNLVYPLAKYTREECHNLIEKAGLPPAHRTSCFFCPLQRKEQWISLYKNHRNLWEDAVELEQNSKYTFIKNITLEKQIKKWLRWG